MTTAHDILQAASGHMEDRASTYDKPAGERSMAATVAAFGAVTGIQITEEQGWLFMAILKAVRSQQGNYRADSYEDGAAYFALCGEAAARTRAPNTTSTSRLDGWAENDATAFPQMLDPYAKVLVRYRDGSESISPMIASAYIWSDMCGEKNIVAYKVVGDQP